MSNMCSKYIIQSDFYNEELRCDFLVSSKRKKVWGIQLKILNEFKNICDKHSLKYYAMGGTLLGAVRHSGFIPWDDDIDVCMPRDDFERFLIVVENELKGDDDLIIQYETFNHNYSSPHARITNRNTTACLPSLLKSKIDVEQGIFIDIFPYDNVPNNQLKKKVHRIIYKLISFMLHDKQNNYTFENKGFAPRVLRLGSRVLFLFTNVNDVFMWTQKYISKYNNDPSCINFGCISSFYQIERFIVKKEWFDSVIELPFENTYIACPSKYEDVLSHTYGDWKKFVKGRSLHQGYFFDPDKSYVYYIDKPIDNIINSL